MSIGVAQVGLEVLCHERKVFWSKRCSLDIVVAFHRNLNCLEVIVYEESAEYDYPRAYLGFIACKSRISTKDLDSAREVSDSPINMRLETSVAKKIWYRSISQFILSHVDIGSHRDTRGLYNVFLFDEQLGKHGEGMLFCEQPFQLKPYTARRKYCGMRKSIEGMNTSECHRYMETRFLEIMAVDSFRFQERTALQATIQIDTSPQQREQQHPRRELSLKWRKVFRKFAIYVFIQKAEERVKRSKCADWYASLGSRLPTNSKIIKLRTIASLLSILKKPGKNYQVLDNDEFASTSSTSTLHSHGSPVKSIRYALSGPDVWGLEKSWTPLTRRHRPSLQIPPMVGLAHHHALPHNPAHDCPVVQDDGSLAPRMEDDNTQQPSSWDDCSTSSLWANSTTTVGAGIHGMDSTLGTTIGRGLMVGEEARGKVEMGNHIGRVRSSSFDRARSPPNPNVRAVAAEHIACSNQLQRTAGLVNKKSRFNRSHSSSPLRRNRVVQSQGDNVTFNTGDAAGTSVLPSSNSNSHSGSPPLNCGENTAKSTTVLNSLCKTDISNRKVRHPAANGLVVKTSFLPQVPAATGSAGRAGAASPSGINVKAQTEFPTSSSSDVGLVGAEGCGSGVVGVSSRSTPGSKGSRGSVTSTDSSSGTTTLAADSSSPAVTPKLPSHATHISHIGHIGLPPLSPGGQSKPGRSEDTSGSSGCSSSGADGRGSKPCGRLAGWYYSKGADSDIESTASPALTGVIGVREGGTDGAEGVAGVMPLRSPVSPRRAVNSHAFMREENRTVRSLSPGPTAGARRHSRAGSRSPSPSPSPLPLFCSCCNNCPFSLLLSKTEGADSSIAQRLN